MLGEKMSSNEEIDLLDFIKYAFNKYLLISFIVFFCIVIGGVFCYINNDKVTLTLDITPKVYSPFFYATMMLNAVMKYSKHYWCPELIVALVSMKIKKVIP